ncbi:MAG: alpha/beta hydrolase [Thermoanaerobaculia bacterium]
MRAARRLSLALAAAAAGTLCCATTRAPGVSFERFPTGKLRKPAPALVLLPPSYGREPSRRYPVLYFLHDGWGDERSLQSHGVASDLRDRMADGRLPEFLVVAPGAPGSWFSDSSDGTERWESFLTGDLLAQVESRYRAIPAPAARGITGISMGGYGAVKLGLKHPRLYGSVSALSGALIPLGWEDLKRYGFAARWTLKRVFGDSPRHNAFAENDIWEILRSVQFEESPFPLYLRGGTEDIYGLGRVGAQFAAFSSEHGIRASAVLEPGGHDWAYWRRAMVPICEWHAARFSYDLN